MEKQFQLLKLALDNDRYTPRRISCLNYDMSIVDGKSFVYQFRDIFVDEVYRFNAETSTPLILDCGANVGLSCLYFKHLYPKAIILAYEADRKIVRHLESNLARNGAKDVRVHNKACWIHDEGVTFEADGADGGHIGSASGSAAVPSIRIRDVLAQVPSVSMLKMDIEGAEVEVLLDCEDVLCRVQHLFFEYHSRHDTPQRLGELLALVSKSGFRYFIQEVGVGRKHPFITRKLDETFDMQLNVYAYR